MHEREAGRCGADRAEPGHNGSRVMLGKLGDLAGLLKQAQRMQADLQRIQAELAERTVEASAGGGVVTARVNGQQDLVALKIDPALARPDEIEMLEDLVVAAVRQATAKSREMAQEALGGLIGGLPPIPGLTT